MGEGLLVCAATEFELAAFPEGPAATRCVSGVGIAQTLLRLLSLPPKPLPGLILNIGIAGAYPETGLAIGDIVVADGETWGDVGFELPDPPGFRAIMESPFGAEYGVLPTVRPSEWVVAQSPLTGRAPTPQPPPSPAREGGQEGKDRKPLSRLGGGVGVGAARELEGVGSGQLKVAQGCTVNSCTGTRATGERRRDRFGSQFETMEGAAVALVGQQWGVPVCEIRAISNIAADRDMRPENIRLALDHLRQYLETCAAHLRVT